MIDRNVDEIRMLFLRGGGDTRKKHTFFETLNDVADERSTVDRHAQQRVGYDTGTQWRTHTRHPATGATGSMVATSCATLDELVELGTAEWS
jgi:hypothetical protein